MTALRNLIAVIGFTLLSSTLLRAQVDNYSAGLNGQKLDWLLYYLEQHYVDKVNSDSLTNLAIYRMVQTLDPYSKYQTKEEVEKQQNSDKGYSGKGLGFNYYMLRDTAIVTYVNDKGPADLAGLLRGDQIIKLDGRSVLGNRKIDLKTAFDNADKETLLLGVISKGVSKEVSVTKALIPAPSIYAAYMMTQSIGYIKIGNFSLKTMEEFIPSLNYLKSLGMQELVIDLRDNNGGVLNQALQLADQFLPANKLTQ